VCRAARPTIGQPIAGQVRESFAGLMKAVERRGELLTYYAGAHTTPDPDPTRARASTRDRAGAVSGRGRDGRRRTDGTTRQTVTSNRSRDPRYASIADPGGVDALSAAAMLEAHLRAMAANG
jgi:hypothetical protein